MMTRRVLLASASLWPFRASGIDVQNIVHEAIGPSLEAVIDDPQCPSELFRRLKQWSEKLSQKKLNYRVTPDRGPTIYRFAEINFHPPEMVAYGQTIYDAFGHYKIYKWDRHFKWYLASEYALAMITFEKCARLGRGPTSSEKAEIYAQFVRTVIRPLIDAGVQVPRLYTLYADAFDKVGNDPNDPDWVEFMHRQ